MKLKINISRWLERIAVTPLLTYRRLRYGYPFRRIRLAQPRYAVVDPEDYDDLREHDWSLWSDGQMFYAVRREGTKSGGKTTIVWMHRQICKTEKGLVVDHINHNGLDNRRANVRACSFAENLRNRRKYRSGTSSRYKGVNWCKRRKRWRARICLNRKEIALGQFTDEVEAAKAYDTAAKKYHGEFACLNFPE